MDKCNGRRFGLGIYGQLNRERFRTIVRHKIAELPIRIYTPLIVDNKGGKLSKSIHMRGGYPEYSSLISEVGQEPWRYKSEIHNIYKFILEILDDAFMFYRNYSVDIIEKVMRGEKWSY